MTGHFQRGGNAHGLDGSWKRDMIPEMSQAVPCLVHLSTFHDGHIQMLSALVMEYTDALPSTLSMSPCRADNAKGEESL